MKNYEILQLKNSRRSYLFLNSTELKATGITPSRLDYDSVYRGEMEPSMTLDDLFARFNIDRPGDFAGHSLSVSDVVVITDEHGSAAWFVDSFGFTQLPHFFDAPEQDHIPGDGSEPSYPPVYTHSSDYAREVGERERYVRSLRENTRCKEAIEEAIRRDYDGMYLKESAILSVLDAFGPRRVSWVLGNTITLKEDDGRFSRSNKAWAQAMCIPLDRDSFGNLRNWCYCVESHPAILDLFTSLTRRELEKRAPQLQSEKAISTPSQNAKTKRRAGVQSL